MIAVRIVVVVNQFSFGKFVDISSIFVSTSHEVDSGNFQFGVVVIEIPETVDGISDLSVHIVHDL